MIRGEVALAGHGFHGRCRREASAIEGLLEALAQSPELEALISDPEVLRAVLPAPFTAVRALGPGSMRVDSPEGALVLYRSPAESPRATPAAVFAQAHAHSLLALGVRTPRVLGWIAPERGGEAPSWWVTPYLSAPSLAELRDAGVWGDPQERRRCVLALADALGRMHRHGWVAPRLYPNRVLVDDEGVLILDPEFLQRGSLAARRRELLRIAEDFSADEIGPMEHLRFLQRYLGPVAGGRALRAEWIDALTRLS